MKRQLTVALGLAVLATPAFATKARLQGLGEDIYGSFYVNDARNIWLNPAQINNHKDMVTFEWGDNNNLADQASTPRSEGGVYKSYGNLVYGVHFGSASNSANQLRAASGIASADIVFADPANPTGEVIGATLNGNANEGNNIDLFVGGDAGIKWGANLGYNRTKDEALNTRSEGLRSRLGVIMGDTQAYANINLINNAKGDYSIGSNNTVTPGGVLGSGTAKFEGKLGYQVGVIHAYEGTSFTVDFRQFEADSTITGTGPTGALSGKKDQSIKQAMVGAGRVTRLNDKANLFTKVSFQWADAKNKQTGTTLASACEMSPFFCEKYETMRVPVVVGIEVDATSWLTVRTSVSQAVWGTEKANKEERTIKNNTVVNAGMSLNFGELSIDGLVSNSNGTTGTLGETTAAGRGTLRLDDLMTRVGVNYRF